MAKRSADVPLCSHVDALIEDLHKFVPNALTKFDSQAIHKARVTTRRLKAAGELLAPVVDAKHRKALRRAGRKLRRRLGPLRDLDVMLGHIDKLPATPTNNGAGNWLRERLLARRERERASAARRDPDKLLAKLGNWWAMRPQIVDGRQAIPSLLSESIHLQLDRFAERAGSISGDPHQLRIAGKALRYTLELAEASGHKLPKMVLRSFKRMQDALGLWHDYVVLTERIMKLSTKEQLALHDPAMQHQLLDLTRRTLARAERELTRFSKLWSDRGDAITQAIRDSFPLTVSIAEAPAATPVEPPTEPPSEPQTGPDLAGSGGPQGPADAPPSAAPAA